LRKLAYVALWRPTAQNLSALTAVVVEATKHLQECHNAHGDILEFLAMVTSLLEDLPDRLASSSNSRPTLLTFCKSVISKHQSAAQMWEISPAGYTCQLVIETLLNLTTGDDDCSHDAQEVLSTWPKTAGLHLHRLD